MYAPVLTYAPIKLHSSLSTVRRSKRQQKFITGQSRGLGRIRTETVEMTISVLVRCSLDIHWTDFSTAAPAATQMVETDTEQKLPCAICAYIPVPLYAFDSMCQSGRMCCHATVFCMMLRTIYTLVAYSFCHMIVWMLTVF